MPPQPPAPPAAPQPRLHVIPISWSEACKFIALHHRHHKPPRGQKFAIGAIDQLGVMHGVATCGRPVARSYDDGLTIEINRTCTDGTSNVNSFLLGASWKVAAAMGYLRILTYTQEGESGISMRAAGWERTSDRPARKSWADSTGATSQLRQLRDPVGAGGVARVLWMKQQQVVEVADGEAVSQRAN